MKTAYLIANGDLRLSANQTCEAAQAAMERQVTAAVEARGWKLRRAHPYDPKKRHGFIDSQKYGMEVFRGIPPTAPLIVAEAVWQYSHHILHGLLTHRGPILTLANWSGTWPGLVGMLNLNGSLTKAGVAYSTLWSENFDDALFTNGLRSWLEKGEIRHDTSHAQPLEKLKAPAAAAKVGERVARKLKQDKAIMGVFDEGCMGMYNAIIPDELLHRTGVFKERLSQSTLYAKMQTVEEEEARAVYRWYLKQGLKFRFGQNEETDLTEAQVLQQCKMYIAAVRLADEFGCATIGIQYQQGLKDLAPASDLVEGTLNNVSRPPVYREGKREALYPGEALPHFNEVDECAGLDGLMTYRIQKALGQPVENTLHDVRWGDWDASGTVKDYVWVFEISGSAPPAHFIGGWKGAEGFRQPPMYFPKGGSTLRGVSKPGEIVWSRIYVTPGGLNMDIGRAGVVRLPRKETERRWQSTTWQWPIMHAVTYGVTRDQFMAKHQANHVQVVYGTDATHADSSLIAKAAMAESLGIKVNLCGTRKGGKPW
jgi:L-fucose isomerase-like protein